MINNELKIQFPLWIRPSLREKVRKEASKNEQTISQYICAAVRQALKDSETE